VEALAVADVAGERVLRRDGDGLSAELEVARIHSPRAIAKKWTE